MSVIRALALSLMSFVVLAAVVPTARAGTYTVRACSREDYSSEFEPMEIGARSPSGGINRCVFYDYGIQAEGYPTPGVWNRGDAYGWLLKAPPRTLITGFQAEVSGHSGYG